MSAAIQVLAGPSGCGKTTHLAERCRESAEQGDVLWLAPSARRAEQVRTLVGGRSRFRVTTFNDLAADVLAHRRPDLRPLPRSQARILIDEVIEELLASKQLTHFERVAETRGFAESVVSLMGELQSAGIARESFFEATRAIESRKLMQLAALYALYLKRMDSLGCCDLERRLPAAVEVLRSEPTLGFRTVIVDDFTSFTLPQSELLRLLAHSCAELWIALPDEEGDERAEMLSDPRRSRAALEPPNSACGFAPVAASLPAGLDRIARHLFRPVRNVSSSSDAEGLSIVEAPGLLGEARMVARRVKELLRDGVAADDVVVAARDLKPYADLLHEVFDEYGIPIDLEGSDSVLHDPAVSLLLRALRLPEDDWPFAGTTALLRSSHLVPTWPEAGPKQEMPLLCDALLRLIGEPRGKDTYLAAVRRWAARPDKGLDFEDAQEARRQKTHELAKRCEPFLTRFFACWDTMPAQARASDHVAWLRRFLSELGLSGNSRSWDRFIEEIGCWIDRDASSAKPRLIDRRTFQRRLHALASSAGTARTRRGPGRVRILSATLACDLDVDHLFVVGLGERGFPRLSTPAAILDENDRQNLRGEGIDLIGANDLHPREMLLFHRLVTRARQRLVLSYPAVDDKGRPMLPSSFLSSLLDLFDRDRIDVERRTMLIEGFDRETPLCPAEDRVGLAREIRLRGRADAADLRPGLLDNLLDAADLQQRRFFDRDIGPYEGMFRDPRVKAEAGKLFGSERVYSPTALEDHVACPFRFLFGHVLRLEPLEEPTEEIEVTRRGQTYHRALAHLHQHLRESGIHAPDENLEEHVRTHLGEAIREDVERAPGDASRTLWKLEGERMLRLAKKYRTQWKKLIDPWTPHNVSPRPHDFEVEVNMSIVGKDGVVKLTGRIDRIDSADLGGELGFWIIDYKTGSGSHYTGKALREFHRLQLTLYAMGVEDSQPPGSRARPLGLAYWLVGEDGPKVVMPDRGGPSWFADPEAWRAVRKALEERVLAVVRGIRSAAYPLRPIAKDCTAICPYGQVCRITPVRELEKNVPTEPTQEQAES